MRVTIPPSQLPKPPLGVLASLRAGFSVVNNRLELALFPLVLDLFLWLGPKLSIKPLVASALRGLDLLAAYSADPQVAQQLEPMRASFTDLGDKFNLFSRLSTAPLGIPSLMASSLWEGVPAGVSQPVWLGGGLLSHLGLFLLFSLIGILLGSIYFNCIAQQIRAKRLDFGQFLRQAGGDWMRLVAFAILVALALIVVLAPVWLVGGLIAAIIPAVGAIVFVLSLTLVMWGVFYLGFTVPAIVVQHRGLFGAVWDSLRVAQWSMSSTAGLYTLLFLISVLLSTVWNLVQPDSWVMLAAVAGNALVSTALVAAAFVFYQDRYRWWGEMRAAIEASVSRQKAAGAKL